MKKQTSNVQPAFGRRGDLRRGRRLILNIQHLLDCHPERSDGPRERALITPDTRKRVLHRIEIAFNRRLLTAAGGIHARKSQEVDRTKTFRCPAFCRQRWQPIGLHAEVRVGV
jgi:hypothetical protein